MPFLVAIADFTHPLKHNRSSIGLIGCYILVCFTLSHLDVYPLELEVTRQMYSTTKSKCFGTAGGVCGFTSKKPEIGLLFVVERLREDASYTEELMLC